MRSKSRAENRQGIWRVLLQLTKTDMETVKKAIYIRLICCQHFNWRIVWEWHFVITFGSWTAACGKTTTKPAKSKKAGVQVAEKGARILDASRRAIIHCASLLMQKPCFPLSILGRSFSNCVSLRFIARRTSSVGRGPTDNLSLCKTGAGAWDTPAASPHSGGKGLAVPGICSHVLRCPWPGEPSPPRVFCRKDKPKSLAKGKRIAAPRREDKTKTKRNNSPKAFWYDWLQISTEDPVESCKRQKGASNSSRWGNKPPKDDEDPRWGRISLKLNLVILKGQILVYTIFLNMHFSVGLASNRFEGHKRQKETPQNEEGCPPRCGGHRPDEWGYPPRRGGCPPGSMANLGQALFENTKKRN